MSMQGSVLAVGKCLACLEFMSPVLPASSPPWGNTSFQPRPGEERGESGPLGLGFQHWRIQQCFYSVTAGMCRGRGRKEEARGERGVVWWNRETGK
ncbi:unnamed protein product [Pleuronectes platessa]|uniref:Uncharacterized protein n=1 Tax=Pleuronectes platessa TaxID=8262 RepID=A0A9N7YT66_PLEPL|nr:unnamed protein product [Pleuronectes platessa]